MLAISSSAPSSSSGSGPNRRIARSVICAPASAPSVAPSMIAGNSRWPLRVLKLLAASAQNCATTIRPYTLTQMKKTMPNHLLVRNG